jgi:Excalibur calcium-binding domain
MPRKRIRWCPGGASNFASGGNTRRRDVQTLLTPRRDSVSVSSVRRTAILLVLSIALALAAGTADAVTIPP